MTETDIKPLVDLTPGKRCSSFDADCAQVRDHLLCWRGGAWLSPTGEIFETNQADGYCPYLIGER